MGELKLFNATAVKDKRPHERVYAAFNYQVVAADRESALRALKARLTFEPVHIALSEDERSAPFVLSGGVYTVTPEKLRRWRGEPEPAPKPPREPKLSNRPLGETQLAVLHSLKEHGGYRLRGNDWLWDTHSATKRLVESLYMRKLAIIDGDRYVISEEGVKELAKHA